MTKNIQQIEQGHIFIDVIDHKTHAYIRVNGGGVCLNSCHYYVTDAFCGNYIDLGLMNFSIEEIKSYKFNFGVKD